MRSVHVLCCCVMVAVSVSSLSRGAVGQEADTINDLFGVAEVSEGDGAADPFGAAATEATGEDNPFGEVAAAADAADATTRCHCLDDCGAAADRIRQSLAAPLQPAGLEFSDQPLESVLDFLQEQYGIPIQLNVQALEEAGLSVDEPVTVNLRNISLRSALRLMLDRLELTTVIRDEVLMITTPEDAAARLITCVYDVRNLVGVRQQKEDVRSLIDAITACVARTSWADHGGTGEIRALRRGAFVIAQTAAVHEEIARLLEAVRQIPRDVHEPTLGDAARSSPGMVGEGDRSAPAGRGGYGRGYEGGYGEDFRGRGEMMGGGRGGYEAQ